MSQTILICILIKQKHMYQTTLVSIQSVEHTNKTSLLHMKIGTTPHKSKF